MALAQGKNLGAYELLGALGAGGMGEVYRARDTRLEREVAIKVLPDVLARDPERVARFQREAKLLASLNHPNVAQIHGFEEADGQKFLVLEFVEGQTLADRLTQGALPVDEALDIGKHIADALEAAHAKDIIHRDLKPGNVMVRPDGMVKVLDFGLARAMAPESAASGTAHDSPTMAVHSPTITANYTRPGVVLGTAAYMSPEQARGRPLDKRTDIWSFGLVLYECLTGETLFRGETATDSMGAIMHKEPDWSLLPRGTPPTVHLLLRRCLAKDRKRRLHDIADARVELEAAIVDPSASSLGLARAAIVAEDRRASRRLLARLLPVLTVALAIGLGYSLFALSRARQRTPKLPLHLNVEVSPAVPLLDTVGPNAVLSPDGTRIVCVAGSGTGAQLYTRRLDQPELTAISGTRGATQPFFSPDGAWIGFFAERKLKRVSVSGGTPISLCEAPGGASRGATWADNGLIFFTPNTTTGIWQVAEAGGAAEQVTELAEHERSHRWPYVLPGGRGLLFTVQDKEADFNGANIELLALDTKERRVLHRGGSYPFYIPTGHVLFAREGTIYAAPFDLDSLNVTGSPAPVLEGVRTDLRNGGAFCAFSQTGLLLFDPGGQVAEDASVVWVDRSGQVTPLIEKLANYATPSLSPNGKKLALTIWEATASIGNLWIYDIERRTLSRLTFSEDFDFSPIWSPDGTRIYFTSTRDSSTPHVYVKPSDGTGAAERITNSEEPQIACDILPDEKTLLFFQENADTDLDLMTLGLVEGAEPSVFLQTPFSERRGKFSPDGRWIAYESNESGEREVYVRPFGHGGGKWQISTDGGRDALWSPDGKELFYRANDVVMAVPVETEGSSFRAGMPTKLFEFDWAGMFWRSFDIAPDGERFVAVKRDTSETEVDRAHLRFVFNWFDDVEARVPTGRN